MDKTVGIVGLGIMGSAIARNLVERGWRVIGFDIDAAKRAELAAANVIIADRASWDQERVMRDSNKLVGKMGVIDNSGTDPTVFDGLRYFTNFGSLDVYHGSPLEDQMMAGLVMALEQSIVMGIALVVLFMQMLNESERSAQQAERFEVA